jgi:hypothetical protein
MFVGVSQADCRKYLHIASDVFEDHPCGSGYINSGLGWQFKSPYQ